MLRRLTVTGLTLGAISVAVLGWTGYAVPIYADWALTDRVHVYLFFADGLARFYGFQADEAIELDPQGLYADMTVRRRTDGAICQRFRHGQPGRIPSYALIARVLPTPPRGPSTKIRMFGIRTWIWVPIVSLTAYPLFIVVFDRWRRLRHKPGHCPDCGYNLTGNISGICPECGIPTAIGEDTTPEYNPPHDRNTASQ